MQWCSSIGLGHIAFRSWFFELRFLQQHE
jgi:hypothetical protein